MTVGQIVYVAGGGYFEVASIPGGTTLAANLTNLEDVTTGAYPTNVPPTTNVAAPKNVMPAGPQGPVGPAGGGGSAPEDATYWCRTANATLTDESNMSALATGYVKVTTATGVPSSVAKIPYTDIDTSAIAGPTTKVLKPSATVATSGQVLDTEIEYKEVALAAGTPCAIDWTLGRAFYKLLAGNTVFTFSGTTVGKQIRVLVKQGTGAVWTATWPAVKWAGGVAPTMTVTSDAYAMFMFDKTTSGDIIGTILNNAY